MPCPFGETGYRIHVFFSPVFGILPFAIFHLPRWPIFQYQVRLVLSRTGDGGVFTFWLVQCCRIVCLAREYTVLHLPYPVHFCRATWTRNQALRRSVAFLHFLCDVRFFSVLRKRLRICLNSRLLWFFLFHWLYGISWWLEHSLFCLRSCYSNSFFCFGKRYVSAAILAFLYFFWHVGTFFFPLVVAVVYAVALIFEGKPWNRWIILAPLVGTSAAMVLGGFLLPGFASGFLESFLTILRIISDTGFSGKAVVQEGGEVYPLNVFDLYGLAPVLMGLFIFFLLRIRRGTSLIWRMREIRFSTWCRLGNIVHPEYRLSFGDTDHEAYAGVSFAFSSVFLLYRLRYIFDLWRKSRLWISRSAW